MRAQDLQRIFQNAQDFVLSDPQIEGEIPEDLSGRLYRVGVGTFFENEASTHHWFDGAGFVICCELERGRARFSGRSVLPKNILPKHDMGRFGYAPPKFLNRVRGIWDFRRYENSANTALMQYQNRLFALYEAAWPTEIDPRSLQTRGETDLEVVRRSFTAHPKAWPGHAAQLGFGFRLTPRPVLDLYVLPQQGKASHLTAVPFNGASFIHDFAVTANFAIFVISPVFVNPIEMLVKGAPLSDCLRFQSKKPTEILVVNLASLEVTRLEGPALLFTHTTNAFENNGRIILDGIVYADGSNISWINSVWPLREKFSDSAPGQLTRLTIDPANKSVTSDTLATESCEVPSINPQWSGRRNRFAYTAGYRFKEQCVTHLYNTLYRYDADAKGSNAFFSDDQVVVSEMIVVPKEGRQTEDAAYGLTQHYVAREHKSSIEIWDLEGSPRHIARIWCDRALPFTFHGLWLA